MAKKTKNPNTNCLEGWQCPDCKSYGDFRVYVSQLVILSDDGTDYADGSDTDYDNSSFAQCIQCGKQATVGYFSK